MLERFGDSGKRLLVDAVRQARALDHAYLGTEHLLLGMLAMPGSGAVPVLARLGVDGDVVRSEVVEIVGRGVTPLGDEGHLPFTPRVRTVLELADGERERLGAPNVEDVHVLLALVREGDGVAAQVLRDVGVRPEDVERAVGELP